MSLSEIFFGKSGYYSIFKPSKLHSAAFNLRHNTSLIASFHSTIILLIFPYPLCVSFRTYYCVLMLHIYSNDYVYLHYFWYNNVSKEKNNWLRFSATTTSLHITTATTTSLHTGHFNLTTLNIFPLIWQQKFYNSYNCNKVFIRSTIF